MTPPINHTDAPLLQIKTNGSKDPSPVKKIAQKTEYVWQQVDVNGKPTTKPEEIDGWTTYRL